MTTNFMITGKPGIGKTTIIRQIAENFGEKAQGFYTEEIREGNRRKGFSIHSLSERKGILAHVDAPSPYRVGRYNVLVSDFEQIAVEPLFQNLSSAKVVIIDEIGKMELFSTRFVEMILTLLDFPVPVVATIMSGSHSLVDQIKKRKDVEIFKVTLQNRDNLPALITKRIQQNSSF